MLTFRVSLPGQDALQIGLQRFGDAIEDFAPFWRGYFSPAWYALMSRQYATEGAETGAKWAALTAAYAAWKQKHFPGRPVGVLTGRTRDALTSQGAPGSVYLVGKDSFVVGTNLDWPIYLQLGTRRMVARPPMRVTDQFMTETGRLLQKFAHDTGQAQLALPGSRLA